MASSPIKVVSSAEMARIDRLAVKSGCKEELFVEKAGAKVAAVALEFGEKEIALLIGKGNKGADAYAAGLALAEEGCRVHAFSLFPPAQCSHGNRAFGEKFSKKGKVIPVWDGEKIELGAGLIIDGILGTGFQGQVEGVVETAIRIANGSKKPIVAIDLPSGLDGTTGMVRGVAIEAHTTVALGFPKMGLFLREGWNHAGQIRVESFGLPEQFEMLAEPLAFLSNPAHLSLPKISRNRHKYQAGYVLGYSGSRLMPGAPKMAGLSALRSGAGIVRIFHKEEIGDPPMELICQKWNAKSFEKELQRASSVFVGPGLGKTPLKWVKKISLPIVLDGDALQRGMNFPSCAVLTPHRGEMQRLLGLTGSPEEEDFLVRCQKFADRHRVVILLKGGPSFLFAHGKMPLILPWGDPGMATAGSGDVLTGVIAAMLAQRLDCYRAAELGAYLHGTAGEIAARHKSSYGLIARDLIEYLPQAFRTLLK